jgi:predicted  nucleic acid-binding Zn-ribbon protein
MVRKKLLLLEDLQELDLKTDGSQARIMAAKAELEALEARVGEAVADLEALKAEIASAEAEKTTLEENLATENANITRSEANLKGITTQKEYQAVNKEIATAKKLIVELEEQILAKIGALEGLNGTLSTREAALSELEGNIGSQKAEVNERISGEEASASADAALRVERLKEIPSGMLKRYEKLRESRRGIAVVEARDGGCLGCNMQIPPQMYNNLHKGEELITCPHCQRILVLRQDAAV